MVVICELPPPVVNVRSETSGHPGSRARDADSRRGADGGAPTFQRRHPFFQHRHRRIGEPRIDKAEGLHHSEMKNMAKGMMPGMDLFK